MVVKFTDLSNAGTLTGAEILALVQSGASVQETLDVLSTFAKTTVTTSSSYTLSDIGIKTLEVNVGTSTITLPDLATEDQIENGVSIKDPTPDTEPTEEREE